MSFPIALRLISIASFSEVFDTIVTGITLVSRNYYSVNFNSMEALFRKFTE
jgi:hypothetical protein